MKYGSQLRAVLLCFGVLLFAITSSVAIIPVSDVFASSSAQYVSETLSQETTARVRVAQPKTTAVFLVAHTDSSWHFKHKYKYMKQITKNQFLEGQMQHLLRSYPSLRLL